MMNPIKATTAIAPRIYINTVETTFTPITNNTKNNTIARMPIVIRIFLTIVWSIKIYRIH